MAKFLSAVTMYLAMILIIAAAPDVASAEDRPATAPSAGASDTASPASEAKPAGLVIPVLYLKQSYERPAPLSLLDIPPADDGVAGAKLAIADNNTTGKFLNQSFKLDVVESENIDELIKAAQERLAGDTGHFILADVEATDLLKLADAMAGKPAVIFNVSSPDDSLREENCRANVLHIPPTRTMLADAIGQYLVWKKWPNWLLVYGPQAGDKLMADAYRRTAKRFGAKIVDEKEFKYESSSRRADGGFEQVQQQIPQFTQSAKDHDVVIVVDELLQFSDYFPYRTWIPRPIVGSAGMSATSWHPALELWGGTQFQNRFRRLNNRIMRPLDYDAWLAVRAVGEAANRTNTDKFAPLNEYIHGPKFEVAAFKGVATTFRNWNGQLRQPIILTTPKLLVSISPQQGFLHQVTELDTLGIDKPETKCKAYAPK